MSTFPIGITLQFSLLPMALSGKAAGGKDPFKHPVFEQTLCHGMSIGAPPAYFCVAVHSRGSWTMKIPPFAAAGWSCSRRPSAASDRARQAASYNAACQSIAGHSPFS
jgi:hypothetical protein